MSRDFVPKAFVLPAGTQRNRRGEAGRTGSRMGERLKEKIPTRQKKSEQGKGKGGKSRQRKRIKKDVFIAQGSPDSFARGALIKREEIDDTSPEFP